MSRYTILQLALAAVLLLQCMQTCCCYPYPGGSGGYGADSHEDYAAVNNYYRSCKPRDDYGDSYGHDSYGDGDGYEHDSSDSYDGGEEDHHHHDSSYHHHDSYHHDNDGYDMKLQGGSDAAAAKLAGGSDAAGAGAQIQSHSDDTVQAKLLRARGFTVPSAQQDGRAANGTNSTDTQPRRRRRNSGPARAPFTPKSLNQMLGHTPIDIPYEEPKEDGETCASNWGCCSLQCSDSKCCNRRRKPTTAACIYSFECCSSNCAVGVCCPDGTVGLNEPCAAASECCSGICTGGVCV